MKINELLEAENPKKYVKPMFQKWEDTLDNAIKAGVNVEDPRTQQELLAQLIGDYARLTKNQISQLHNKIMSSDLSNDNQVRDIMTQAVTQTLTNRGVPMNVLEPTQTKAADSQTVAAPPTRIPARPAAGSLDQGVTVVSKEPIMIKYSGVTFGLGNRGEWITKPQNKPVSDEAMIAFLDKQHSIIDQQG